MMQPCPPESNISPETFDADTPRKDNSENAEEPNVDMPTSDCTILPDDVIALGNPRQMLQNAGLAASVEDLLESSSMAKRAAIITWMQPAVLELALSANGTRVIQKAIQVTGGETQFQLSQCLHGHARQLLQSHHGNHVLQTIIVMMPPHAVHFIFHELSFFPGGWACVARHQFGCRVVERMFEHCPAQLTLPIVEAVAAEIDSLSRHPFANYVIQHILEYVPAHRHHVVHALIQVGVPLLAQHRVASNIVERAFEHCDAENQRAMAEAILSTPPSIVEMGCSRYGSFTVRRMLEKLQDPLRHMAVQQLSVAIPGLRASKHGRHIAGRVSAALSNLDGAHS
jgi:pumilio RNA-binding family